MTDTTTYTSREVVERYMDAIASGDEQGIRDSFAEDATWWLHGELPIAGTWRGRDAILDDFLGKVRNYLDAESISIEVTSILVDGDRVAAEWTSRARTTGGRPYENYCAAVFTVEAGRIASVREYMDTLYAQRTVFGD